MDQQPEIQMQPPAPIQRQNSLGIPIAIVLAAGLIAGAIVYTGMLKSGNPIQVGNGEKNEQVTAEIEVAPVTDKDHIRGNPNAPIMIVEYSDFDCPFCKNFHETMNKIMAEYGKDGKVAWVFRQYPISGLHPNSPKVAAASECVAKLGGNDAFWKFSDLAFGDRTINEPTNITRLSQYAESAGVSKLDFTKCADAKIYDEAMAKIYDGAHGTPYTILMYGDQRGVINGAQPYTVVKQMIDVAIKQLGG